MSSYSKGMSQARREKLEKLKEREDLKSVLVHKFRSKYQGENNIKTHSIASSVINAEVNKFLETEKLNEENLRNLDDRIGEGRQKGDKKVTPALSSENMSIRSILSAKSERVSRISTARKTRDQNILSELSRPFTGKSALSDDEDEWTQLSKLNQLLHYEEAKKTATRDQEKKRSVQTDLERQIEEKKRRQEEEQRQQDAYDRMMDEHHEFLKEKEAEKEKKRKQKLMDERESRERQMKEERMRKKQEKRKQLQD